MTDMSWLQSTSINLISIVIVLTFAASVLKDFSGRLRFSQTSSVYAGGSGYRHSVHVYCVERGPMVSPVIQTWLKGQNLQIPSVEISMLKQAYYTVMTSFRDFPLLRFGVLFILGYVIIEAIA